MKHAITGICFVISFSTLPLTAQKQLGQFAASLKPGEREYAKRIDADLAKQCRASDDLCLSANLILQAQMCLGAWGYGIKFTGEADPDTSAAIRLYQQRNGLVATGKLNGLTVLRMEADEKEIEEYAFNLPPFHFYEKYFTSYFKAMGVFRDTSTGQTSGPIEVECDRDWQLCFEVESTSLDPGFAKMNIKEWTEDHIVAEEVALCYTNQLRIERASKSVTHTSTKTRNDGPCAQFPAVLSEELVDGIKVQLERNAARAAAVRRVKLVSGYAKAQMESGQQAEAKK